MERVGVLKSENKVIFETSTFLRFGSNFGAFQSKVSIPQLRDNSLVISKSLLIINNH